MLTLGLACEESTESVEQAAARMIDSADEESLDGELAMLRPDPF